MSNYAGTNLENTIGAKNMNQEAEPLKPYNVLPGTKMGLVTAEYLEKVAAVIRKYDIPLAKITSAQRLAIAGHAPEQLEGIWRDLGQKAGPAKPAGVHYVQACPGVRWCKYGRQDSLALGEKLGDALAGLALPGKTKVGISGCPMNCCESYIRDIGVFGKKKGWTFIFGGNGGGCPRIGDIMAEGLDDQQLLDLVRKSLNFYKERARKFERTGRLMRRTSLEELKEAIGKAVC
jgi:NAD(P)H-nitrite reductase large subunit